MGIGINRSGRVNPDRNPYEVFQDAIFARTGYSVSVFVNATTVSIRSKNPDLAAHYREYIEAKSAIKGMTSLEIIHDKVK